LKTAEIFKITSAILSPCLPFQSGPLLSYALFYWKIIHGNGEINVQTNRQKGGQRDRQMDGVNQIVLNAEATLFANHWRL